MDKGINTKCSDQEEQQSHKKPTTVDGWVVKSIYLYVNDILHEGDNKVFGADSRTIFDCDDQGTPRICIFVETRFHQLHIGFYLFHVLLNRAFLYCRRVSAQAFQEIRHRIDRMKTLASCSRYLFRQHDRLSIQFALVLLSYAADVDSVDYVVEVVVAQRPAKSRNWWIIIL